MIFVVHLPRWDRYMNTISPPPADPGAAGSLRPSRSLRHPAGMVCVYMLCLWCALWSYSVSFSFPTNLVLWLLYYINTVIMRVSAASPPPPPALRVLSLDTVCSLPLDTCFQGALTPVNLRRHRFQSQIKELCLRMANCGKSLVICTWHSATIIKTPSKGITLFILSVGFHTLRESMLQSTEAVLEANTLYVGLYFHMLPIWLPSTVATISCLLTCCMLLMLRLHFSFIDPYWLPAVS